MANNNITVSQPTPAAFNPTLDYPLVVTGVGSTPVVGQLPFYQFSPIIQATCQGAKFNVKVVNDAAITNGQATLTSATAAFTSADTGKAFSVAGAGPLVGGYRQALYATGTYVNATTMTMSGNASATVSGARCAYGADDTANLQAAVDLAKNLGTGAVVVFPPGRAFVTLLAMNAVAYSGITLRGSGRDATALENPNPAYGYNGTNFGMVSIGGPLSPPNYVAGATVCDMEIRQCLNATNADAVCIGAICTDRLQVYGCRFTTGSYPGLYTGGSNSCTNTVVRDNYADGLGVGGPAVATTQSAYNLNGSDVQAYNNRAVNCGQGFEGGNFNQWFHDNYVRSNVANAIGFQMGSTNSGCGNMRVENNTVDMTGNATATGVVFGSGGAQLNRFHVDKNHFINCGIQVSGGSEFNSLPNGAFTTQIDANLYADGLTHGTSSVNGNTFEFTTGPLANANWITLNAVGPNYLGLEKFHVIDNTATYGAGVAPYGPLITYACGGGNRWLAATVYTHDVGGGTYFGQDDLVVPVTPLGPSGLGLYYRAMTTGTSHASVEPTWPTVTAGRYKWMGSSFTTGVPVVLGQTCQGITGSARYHTFKATTVTTGITSASEPSWTLGGGTTTDGGVVWTDQGVSAVLDGSTLVWECKGPRPTIVCRNNVQTGPLGTAQESRGFYIDTGNATIDILTVTGFSTNFPSRIKDLANGTDTYIAAN